MYTFIKDVRCDLFSLNLVSPALGTLSQKQNPTHVIWLTLLLDVRLSTALHDWGKNKKPKLSEINFGYFFVFIEPSVI